MLFTIVGVCALPAAGCWATTVVGVGRQDQEPDASALEPVLMAVCVGCSCDFLTPMGHQSNTVVMGPGGSRLSDYSGMWLPFEILIIVALPLILGFWPLVF